MSSAERYAWFSLVAWIAILFFLLMRFTDGIDIWGHSLGLTVVDQPAGRLLGTYVALAVAAIMAESVIAAVMAAQTGNHAVEKDERDHAIEARANLAAYWFTAAALNVIVLHVLANAAFAVSPLAGLNLATVTGMAFALLFVLTMAEIVKRIAVIWNYRAA